MHDGVQVLVLRRQRITSPRCRWHSSQRTQRRSPSTLHYSPNLSGCNPQTAAHISDTVLPVLSAHAPSRAPVGLRKTARSVLSPGSSRGSPFLASSSPRMKETPLRRTRTFKHGKPVHKLAVLSLVYVAANSSGVGSANLITTKRVRQILSLGRHNDVGIGREVCETH